MKSVSAGRRLLNILSGGLQVTSMSWCERLEIRVCLRMQVQKALKAKEMSISCGSRDQRVRTRFREVESVINTSFARSSERETQF